MNAPYDLAPTDQLCAFGRLILFFFDGWNYTPPIQFYE